MDIGKVALLIIILMFVLIIVTTIWRAIFNSSVRKLKNKAAEYLAVIDISVSVKADFLKKLIKFTNLKKESLFKLLNNSPLPQWTNLEREIYINKLNQSQKQITLLAQKSKSNIKEVKRLLTKIENTDQRINNYVFIYNNNVLKYNYKLSTKQGMFFLNSKRFIKKELLKIENSFTLN